MRLLVEAGIEVHALHRSAEQAEGLAALGAYPVQARLGVEAEMERALTGVERLFLLTPPVPHQVDLDRQAIDLAARAGLQQLVRVSASDSNVLSPIPWARAHAWSDHRLAATDLDWTSIRPSAFMQNLLAQAPTLHRGLLPHAAGTARLGWIDAQDVARVAARILLDGPGPHRRATYFLTGPEALSYSAVAERLTDGLGRRVRAVPLPKTAYVLLLRAAGQDRFTAAGLGAQFADVVRHHTDTDLTQEVDRLTGIAPRGLETWIDENRRRL